MAEPTLQELSRKMAKLDFAMLATRTADGGVSARPMSNNGDVEYRGDSWFFAYRDSRKVAEIMADAGVVLSYTGAAGMLGGPPLFVTVEGRATVIEDKATFAEHWTSDLDRYFPEGIDTPGVVMLKVHAERIRYWDGADDGEILP